jgi:hypothetical protein
MEEGDIIYTKTKQRVHEGGGKRARRQSASDKESPNGQTTCRCIDPSQMLLTGSCDMPKTFLTSLRCLKHFRPL